MPDFNTMTKAGIADWALRHHRVHISTAMTKPEMVAEAERLDAAPPAPAAAADKQYMVTDMRQRPVVVAVNGRVHEVPVGRPVPLADDVLNALRDAGVAIKELNE